MFKMTVLTKKEQNDFYYSNIIHTTHWEESEWTKINILSSSTSNLHFFSMQQQIQASECFCRAPASAEGLGEQPALT